MLDELLGCEVSAAGKASPWHLGAVKRHGGTWKGIWKPLCWSQQMSGLEQVRAGAVEVNTAKNSLARRAEFSPEQWVLGRSVHLPGDLLDDSEVARTRCASMQL